MSENRLFYTAARMYGQSECEKDEYRFNCNEWDIEKIYSGVRDLEKNRYNNVKGDYVRITKKKPKSKLEWKEVTPEKLYRSFMEGEHGEVLTEISRWQDDFRLVQFKITGVDRRTYFPGGAITWTRPHPNSGLSRYCCDNTLDLICHRELWSAPIVVLIKFYEKLDSYVQEFNEKLNGGE